MTRMPSDKNGAVANRETSEPLRHIVRAPWKRPAFMIMNAAFAENGTFSNPDAGVTAS